MPFNDNPEQVLAPTVVVFCKRPHAGSGKQRLATEIGAADAHQIAEALLDCALEDVQDWPGRVIISPANAADESWASGLLPGAGVIVQQPGNLGRRLQRVDRELREAGHEQRLFIGTDAPLLSPQTLAEAARILRDNDVVLQPARDGGVTLMASRPPWPDLAELPWSTPDLCLSLQATCLCSGHRVGLLPIGTDVDWWSDLETIRKRLEQDRRPARQRLLDLMNDMLAVTGRAGAAGG